MAVRVLHLIDSGGLYGAEHMLLNLVTEQRRAGMSVLILSAGTPDCGDKPLEVEARRRGLPVLPYRMRAGLNIRQGLEIARFARREGFDILHSHGYKFNIIIGLLPRRLRGLTLVSTMHGYVSAGRWSRLNVYRVLERLMLPRHDGVVFVSQAMAATRSMAQLRLRRSAVIHNGIDRCEVGRLSTDTQATALQQIAPAAAAASKVIGAVGRLSEEKGYDILIRAFADLQRHHSGLYLVILGDGPLRDRLQREIDRRRLGERVCLAGFVRHIQRIMLEFDIFVMPSLSEGLPMTLLEACALNKPVVASNVGGIPEVLGHYSAGELVAPGDSGSLGQALRRLLDNAAGRHAAGALDDSFTASYMADAYRRFYLELLDQE